MTKFSNKFKNPYFWPFFGVFSHFWGKIFFPENLALSRTTSYGILAPFQNLEKANDIIPTKHPDRWKDSRIDRPYFIGPFRLLLGVQ